MAKTCLMMVAGERSGDIYGAELAASLRARLSGVEIFGCGGEAMRRAGVETLVDAHRIAILGITEILSGLPRIYRAFRSLLRGVDRLQPQLAVLIDFPGFNLPLAKKLKRRKIPIVYFVSPQIWAWRRRRIKLLKAFVDKMLCLFDFEVPIYQKAGIQVECVGHPLVDLVRPRLTRQEFFAQSGLSPNTPTLALLPGSREKEISFNLPTMLDAATRLAHTRPIQFALAVAPTLDRRMLDSLLRKSYVGKAPVRCLTHATYDVLQYSDVAIVASGTATLEAALCERPMIVVYRVSRLTWAVGRHLIYVPCFSLVNLLASKPIVSELIQEQFNAQQLAAQVEYLLEHREAREKMVKDLRAIRPRLGPGGATERAADAVIDVLQPSTAALQRA